MKVVVTGATGFVGRWLVNELLEQKEQVTVVVRNKERVPEEWNGLVYVVEASGERGIKLSSGDFPEGKADILFHLAWDGTSGPGRADVRRQLQNVQTVCDMVSLAKNLRCDRFVNAGSIMEYEAVQYIPEAGSEPGLGYIYSTAKLAADFMAKTEVVSAGIDYINVVISNIYGPGEQSERFLNTTLRKMMNHESIPLTHGNQLYDFIYVSDAVKAIILAAKKGEKNSAYYIGNTVQYPLKHFILQMKKVLKSRSELLFGEVPFRGTDLKYYQYETEKLERLGFVPEVDFSTGIKLTGEWMQGEENGNKF